MALTTFIPPVLEILGITALLSLGVSLAYKYFTDQAVMKEIKASQKKLQDQLKLHKSDPDKVMEINKQLIALNGSYMKHTMKPMLITMVPFFLVFGWLKAAYGEAIIIPLSFWEGHLQWLGTYLIFSVILTSVFRKLLKVA